MNIAIIFAGGVGRRLGNEANIPKQFLHVNSKPIIIHTLELFQQNENIDKIYIAIHPDYYELMEQLVEQYFITKTAGIVNGGKTGQDSIYNALVRAAEENPADSIVLLHDGVRPHVTQEVIDRNIETAKKYGTAITCTPCTETILISNDGELPQEVPYRKDTFSGQAPQTFILKEILEAHEIERKTNPDYEDVVDSCTLFKKQGKATKMVMGNLRNIKITTLEDLYIFRALIRYHEDCEIFNSKKQDLVGARYGK